MAVDFAAEMLEYAQKRPESQQSWNAARIDWIEADAMDLKYADDTFDAATMGYGLRNVSTRCFCGWTFLVILTYLPQSYCLNLTALTPANTFQVGDS